MNSRRQNTEKGVILLISVVVASLVLALGVGIGNIISKEVVLTSLSKNSRVAFFAADAGIECAMHWDLVRIVAIDRQSTNPERIAAAAAYPTSVFATSTPSVNAITAGNFYGSESMASAKFNPFCANQPALDMFNETEMQERFNRSVASAASDPVFITRFYFYPTIPDTIYSTLTEDEKDAYPCVLVRVEKEEISTTPLKFQTSIFSEGFSSCDENDLRRVSRGLRVDYSI